MNNLQVVEYQAQRVLTTQQLAEGYETDERRISENFNRNKDRYEFGKHFYLLEGEELKGFKREYANCVVAENLKASLPTESQEPLKYAVFMFENGNSVAVVDCQQALHCPLDIEGLLFFLKKRRPRKISLTSWLMVKEALTFGRRRNQYNH